MNREVNEGVHSSWLLSKALLHGYVIGRVRFYKKAKNVSISLVERIEKNKIKIVMKVWDMIYNNLFTVRTPL